MIEFSATILCNYKKSVKTTFHNLYTYETHFIYNLKFETKNSWYDRTEYHKTD